jgi:5-methyltetrahydrofolate--homocysteine methyltransferase
MDLLESIADRIEHGDAAAVAALTSQAVHHPIPAKDILDRALIEGMNVVGKKYKNHEIFLPDVLMAAKAMYAGMDVLKPLFLKEDVPTIGKVIIGTVYGDLHDIGKNLVSIMLKGAGFEVIDLGNNVSPERFIEAAEQEDAQCIGLSALLTTTMPVMQQVIDLLEQKGLHGKIKVIIGGASVNEVFAHEIGADAYGYDSANAVDTVKRLMAERSR